MSYSSMGYKDIVFFTDFEYETLGKNILLSIMPLKAFNMK